MIFYTPDKLVYESALIVNDNLFIETYKSPEEFEREYNEQCRLINESCYKRILESKNKPELIEQIIRESEDNIIVRFFSFIFNAIKSLIVGIIDFIKGLFGGGNGNGSYEQNKAEEIKESIKKNEKRIQNYQVSKSDIEIVRKVSEFRNNVELEIPRIDRYIDGIIADQKTINQINLTFDKFINEVSNLANVAERNDIMNMLKHSDFYDVYSDGIMFGVDKLNDYKKSVGKDMFISIKHNDYCAKAYPFIGKFIDDFMRLSKEIEDLGTPNIQFVKVTGSIYDVTNSVSTTLSVHIRAKRLERSLKPEINKLKTMESKMNKILESQEKIPNDILKIIKYIANDYYNALTKYVNMIKLKITLLNKYESVKSTMLNKLGSYNKETMNMIENDKYDSEVNKFEFDTREYLKNKLKKRNASEVTSNPEDFDNFMRDKNSTIVFQ